MKQRFGYRGDIVTADLLHDRAKREGEKKERIRERKVEQKVRKEELREIEDRIEVEGKGMMRDLSERMKKERRQKCRKRGNGIAEER